MSNATMTAVFKHSASKGSARLVLLAMADEANDEGLLTAYRRSHRWLASKANVDSGTVARAVKALVDLGEVEVLQIGDGRASTDYRVILPGIESEGGRDAPPQIRGGARRVPRGRETRTQGARDAPPIIPFSPVVTPVEPRGAEKRRRLPDPFVVTSAMQEWAGTSFPDVDWRAETEQFRDYHRGKGSTMLDWEATWRTWIRNAGTRFAPRGANGTRPIPMAKADQRALEAIEWVKRQEEHSG